jgi:hypothetical protein
LANRESLETDAKGTLVKKISMEYSTSYFAEIVAHVMMIMDINFMQSEELFKKVKKLFIQLIENFSKLQLDTLKEAILEEYYNDLVFSMVNNHLQQNKAITLVYKLLAKVKQREPQQTRHTNRFPSQSENIERLSTEILAKTNKATTLIGILVNILQNINLENHKQVNDSYININAYASLLSEKLLVGKSI